MTGVSAWTIRRSAAEQVLRTSQVAGGRGILAELGEALRSRRSTLLDRVNDALRSGSRTLDSEVLEQFDEALREARPELLRRLDEALRGR